MTDVWVKSYTHLKDRPRADRALELLQRVASLVKPIMRKHGWVLPMLSEFFPDSPQLIGLNVNGGEQILLRLRPPWAPDTFYDIEDVVHTMLHELTHNVHGPHDNAFYSFLSKLEEEYYELKRTGYAGEGFFSPGKRLGGDTGFDVPPHIARLKALEAAEKRRQLEAIMKGGGRLGGGATGDRALTPRELAARAAERRARDEKSCGSHSGIDILLEAARATKDGIKNLVSDIPKASGNSGASIRVAGPSSLPSGAPPTNRLKKTPQPPPIPRSTRPVPLAEDEKQWSCGTCTLLNPPMVLQCQACFSNRPVDPNNGWSCTTCGEIGIPHEFLSCSFCGEVKGA